MSRAEQRRKAKEQGKKAKTYIMTDEEIRKIEKRAFDKATKQYVDRYETLAKETFQLMLGIPCNVLIADYWQKTAEKRIPGFVEKCMDLFDVAYGEKGIVSTQEILDMTEKYAKIQLVDRISGVGKVAYSEKYGGDM